MAPENIKDYKPENDLKFGVSYTKDRRYRVAAKDLEFAQSVIGYLRSVIDQSGYVTLHSMDMALGHGPGSSSDQRFGWTSLDDVNYVFEDGTCYISLPTAKAMFPAQTQPDMLRRMFTPDLLFSSVQIKVQQEKPKPFQDPETKVYVGQLLSYSVEGTNIRFYFRGAPSGFVSLSTQTVEITVV